MWWWLLACGGQVMVDSDSSDAHTGSTTGDDTGMATGDDTATAEQGADVQAVATSGTEADWTFAVTLFSDDEGCSHYADWWEIVGQDGGLIYRRILNHSHVDEQPFTRDGGPVGISGDETVWVRGHQNDRGYGGVAMSGTVSGGFVAAAWLSGLGDGLELEEPLPEDCWY